MISGFSLGQKIYGSLSHLILKSMGHLSSATNSVFENLNDFATNAERKKINWNSVLCFVSQMSILLLFQLKLLNFIWLKILNKPHAQTESESPNKKIQDKSRWKQLWTDLSDYEPWMGLDYCFELHMNYFISKRELTFQYEKVMEMLIRTQNLSNSIV